MTDLTSTSTIDSIPRSSDSLLFDSVPPLNSSILSSPTPPTIPTSLNSSSPPLIPSPFDSSKPHHSPLSSTEAPPIASPKRSKHSRRPSRAERYENLVEGARRLSLKGIGDDQEEEDEEPIPVDEWRNCVKNLLLVVDGMTRQLSTHDELAAQLKIAESNLTLAETHSDYLEETLRRNSASTRPNHHVRTESNGSATLVGSETVGNNEIAEPSRGFFARNTRRKTPSTILTASSPIGGISMERSISSSPGIWNEQESTIRVSELTTEVVTLRELADKFRIGEETVSKSKEALEKKCGELEKTKNDLMDELENLSVELFQEANTMVAEERKARSKAEEESVRLKEEVERLEREIESVRGGEDYGGATEGLRRAEEELELVLGLHTKKDSIATPSIAAEDDVSTSVHEDVLSPLVSDRSLSRDPLDDKSSSTRSWFNFNLSGLKKKSSTSDFNSPTSPISTIDLPVSISPTTRNMSLTIPTASTSAIDLSESQMIRSSRRSSHLSETSTMTSDSNNTDSRRLSNSFSDASTSPPFPDDLDYEERDEVGLLSRREGKSFESIREEKEAEEKKEVEEEDSLRSPLTLGPESSQTIPSSSSGLITPVASTFALTSEPFVSSPTILSPRAEAFDDSSHTFNSDFPPEAAYPSTEDIHDNYAAFYPLPPSPTTSSFSSTSTNSNVTSTPSKTTTPLRNKNRPVDATTLFFTPPTLNTSSFNSVFTPPNSVSAVDSSGEETPKKVTRRPLPVPIDPRSSFSSNSSSTSVLDKSAGLSASSGPRLSAATMLLQSLNEGKVTPKSPNVARWKEKSNGLTSPPLTNILLRRSSTSGAGNSPNSEKSSPLPASEIGGEQWSRSKSEPNVIPLVSASVSPLSSSTSRPPLPTLPATVRNRRGGDGELEVDTRVVKEPTKPIAFGEIRRELPPATVTSTFIPRLPSFSSSSTISSNLLPTLSSSPTKPIPFTNTTTNNVPLPPGTTSSSYTGISPSSSFQLGPSIPPTATSSSPTKSLKTGGMVDDLDSLMRNIVDMSASLFGDDLEDEEVEIRSDEEEVEGAK